MQNPPETLTHTHTHTHKFFHGYAHACVHFNVLFGNIKRKQYKLNEIDRVFSSRIYNVLNYIGFRRFPTSTTEALTALSIGRLATERPILAWNVLGLRLT